MTHSLLYLSKLAALAVALVSSGAVFVAAQTTTGIDGATFAKTKFDYIIVGGGTGGVAVASRLSENPKVTVGIIEAGLWYPDEPKINYPGMFGYTIGDPHFDWLFNSVPQPALGNRTYALTRGKVLGGSSALNFMGFTRGSVQEYQAWEDLGNPGWNWDSILTASKKTEKITPDDPSQPEVNAVNRFHYDPAAHGTDGPVHTSHPIWSPNINGPFYATLDALGVPALLDGDNGNNVGQYATLHTVDRPTASRHYSASAFYAPFKSRPNFKVLTGAQATKIVLGDKKDKNGNYKATGVQYHFGNSTYTVQVNKEVVLGAGTVQTPQILELSGIGNPTILKKYGITTKVNLPGVGENYQEHLQMFAVFELTPDFPTRDILNDPAVAAEQLSLYQTNKTGLYTSSISSVAYLPFQAMIDPTTYAGYLAGLDKDLAAAQPHLSQIDKETYAIQRKWLDSNETAQIEFIAFPQYFGPGSPKPNTNYLSLSVFPQHAFNRGNIHIQSSDPLAAPAIDPKFLPFAFDKQISVASMRYTLKMAQVEPLASAIVAPVFPAFNSTDAELEQLVTDSLVGSLHPVGTASMLPRAKGGVVSPRLVVYGTSNVRVADASIWPNHLSAHPQSTIYATAQKAYEFIIADDAAGNY